MEDEPIPSEPPTITLSVSKTVTCDPRTNTNIFEACNRITTEIFPNESSFELTANNLNPDSFVGSTVPVIVTLDPGIYQLNEIFDASVQTTLSDIQTDVGVGIYGNPIFSENCVEDPNDPLLATGTIAGVTQTCNIDNHFEVFI
ncbi:MAG: hypothetical protein AB7F53_01500 [Nitrososphaeraceae archaeon]